MEDGEWASEGERRHISAFHKMHFYDQRMLMHAWRDNKKKQQKERRKKKKAWSWRWSRSGWLLCTSTLFAWVLYELVVNERKANSMEIEHTTKGIEETASRKKIVHEHRFGVKLFIFLLPSCAPPRSIVCSRDAVAHIPPICYDADLDGLWHPWEREQSRRVANEVT